MTGSDVQPGYHADVGEALADVARAIGEIASRRRLQRPERQARRSLDRADFATLCEAGLLRLPAPIGLGGMWESLETSVRPICSIYRHLAMAEPSVALVASMHPAVISFWLLTEDLSNQAWEEQRNAVFASAMAGHWWGTITSEPGSGGDLARTRASATPLAGAGFLPGHRYAVTGDKNFGSGLGIADRMMTTTIPEGESEPTLFVLDVHARPWNGSEGFTLTAEWDGVGMAARQSHAVKLEAAPSV